MQAGDVQDRLDCSLRTETCGILLLLRISLKHCKAFVYRITTMREDMDKLQQFNHSQGVMSGISGPKSDRSKHFCSFSTMFNDSTRVRHEVSKHGRAVDKDMKSCQVLELCNMSVMLSHYLCASSSELEQQTIFYSFLLHMLLTFWE